MSDTIKNGPTMAEAIELLEMAMNVWPEDDKGFLKYESDFKRLHDFLARCKDVHHD